MSDAAAVNIKIKSDTDTSGVSATERALGSLERGIHRAGDEWEHFGRRLGKKFSLPDIGKEVLAGLGLGSGYALAERAASLIEGYYEQAAEHAKAIAEASERSLAAVEKAMRLRRTDEQELGVLQERQKSELKTLAELNAPKFQNVTERVLVQAPGNILSPHGAIIGYQQAVYADRTVSRPVPQSEKDKKEAADLKAKTDERDNEITELKKKIAADKNNFDAELNQSDIAAAQADEEARSKSAEMGRQILEQRKQETAEILAASDAEAKFAQEVAKINALRNVTNGLTNAQADAAIAKLRAEKEDLVGKAIRASREEVEQYDVALEALDKNPALSDREKYQERIRLIDAQTAAIARAKEALTALMQANPGLDTGALTEALNRFGQQRARNAGNAQPAQTLQQRDAIGLSDLSDPAKHYQSAGDGLIGGLSQQIEALGTAGDRVANTLRDTIGGAFDTITQHLTALIAGTEGWRQGLLGIVQTIGTDLIGGIVRLGVEWVEQQILMSVFGKAIAAASNAAMVPIAAGAAAIWAPAATLAAIATLGGAALAAPAEILAAQGAVAATSVLGLADGAIVRGPGGPTDDLIPRMLSNGEAVTRASSVAKFGEPFFHSLNAGVLDLASLPANIARQAAAPAGTAAAPHGLGGSSAGRSLNIALLDPTRDQSTIAALERDPNADTWFVDMLQRHRRHIPGVRV